MTLTSRAHWLIVYLIAASFVLGGWFAFEKYWRSQDYAPTVMDSLDLWSQHRARASRSAPPLRVALLGASRIQYGIRPDVFRDEAARLGLDVDAIMLAVNGHYPMAALRDLAQDPKFKGVALVGVDSRGMDRRHWDMQLKHTQYYHHDWSPARHVHRRLLTQLQQHFIAARPDFALVTLIKRRLDGQGPPWREYVTFNRDRAGGTFYTKSDITAIRNARVADLRKYYPLVIPPPPAEWLGELREAVRWAEAINARGGKVVFYREPVSGEHLELDEQKFPRSEYWDKLAAIMPATMIDFRDVPALNAIDTPDTSHIDAKDIDRHSRALVQALRAKGVF